jgi:L-aminopeptidase/D-esterase-like protein
MAHAMKSGVGSWTVTLDGQNAGVLVSALAVVNALGDVRDPATGKIVAGARKTAEVAPGEADFADSARLMKSMGPTGFTRENTTLVIVATNAALTKVEATKLAQLGQLGVARAINPVNTMSDGDLVVAMSCGTSRAPIDALGVAASEAVAEAILRAVRLAPSLGGLPGLKK